jgi:hypothetical protein
MKTRKRVALAILLSSITLVSGFLVFYPIFPEVEVAFYTESLPPQVLISETKVERLSLFQTLGLPRLDFFGGQSGGSYYARARTFNLTLTVTQSGSVVATRSWNDLIPGNYRFFVVLNPPLELNAKWHLSIEVSFANQKPFSVDEDVGP